MLKVFIIGAGKAGKSLAALIAEKKVEVVGIYDVNETALKAAQKILAVRCYSKLNKATLKDADIILVAVPDSVIGKTGKYLSEKKLITTTQVVAHLSGSQPPSALRLKKGYCPALFHPLLSLADLSVARDEIKKAFIAIAGEAFAKRRLALLARRLGATPVSLDEKNLPLYHSAATIVGNLPAALYLTAKKLFRDSGMKEMDAERAALTLLASAAKNLVEKRFPDGLTGPISRADAETIARHIESLNESDKTSANIYRTLSRIILAELEKRKTLSKAELGRIKKLL
ncbi:MAG: Rossmann-like and DUF2520 domain-containing protein [Myxococcota bacterium]